MNHRIFLQEQEKVYSKFRNTHKIEAEGAIPSSAVLEGHGGYLILLRHQPHITDELAEFSRKVSGIIPSVAYDKTNAHTTISDYGIAKDFLPDENLLKKLLQGVYNAKDGLQKLEITYFDWLYNQNTALAAGIPNAAFLNVADEVIACIKREGIELRYPWGAHMTSNRFIVKKTPEELKEFFELAKTFPPLGTSMPHAIDVGYFFMSPEKFSFEVCDRFML